MCLCVCMYGLCMHVCLCMRVSKGACGDQRSMSDVFLLLSALSFVTGHPPQPPCGSTGWWARPGLCLSLRSTALGCEHALVCPALTWMLRCKPRSSCLLSRRVTPWAISWATCVCLSSFNPSTGVFTSLCCPGWHQACDRPVLVSRYAPPHDLWHLWQALVLSEKRLPSSRGLIPLVCVQCMHMWGWTRLCPESTVLLYPSHSSLRACV